MVCIDNGILSAIKMMERCHLQQFTDPEMITLSEESQAEEDT